MKTIVCFLSEKKKSTLNQSHCKKYNEKLLKLKVTAYCDNLDKKP